MSQPTQKLHRIMLAVKKNFERITVANGFLTDVALVAWFDVVRDKDVDGVVILIGNVTESYEYLTGDTVHSTTTYDVAGHIPDEHDADLLNEQIHNFVSDVWRAHRNDHHLKAADLALGNSGEQLVTEHRIVGARRLLPVPEAAFVMQMRFKYRFQATDV